MTESGRLEGIVGFVAQGDKKVVPLPIALTNDFLALTQRVAAGDDAAAREFFEKYCDRLFRYALVMTRGDEDLARELLSLTMIKAARHMRPLGSDDDIWRWMTRIARNCFIDHCRKNRQCLPLTEAEVNVASNIDATMSSALDEALAELSSPERDLVERFYFDEQSQAALADDIHSTRKAVESRLARIRHKLRAAILRKLS